MNKLEEQFNVIFESRKEKESFLTHYGCATLAISCASLTKDVAVKFHEWMNSEDSDEIYYGGMKELPDLFDYFITNIYKP